MIKDTFSFGRHRVRRPLTRKAKHRMAWFDVESIMRNKHKLYWRLFRGLMANPRYFLFTLRRSAHARMAERLAKGDIPENGTFYPVKLDLRLLYGCNLRCRMCAQWGKTGTYFDYDAPKLKQMLAPDAVEQVVRALAPEGLRYVDMEGGETFLYPEIIALFKMLKSYGLFVKPVTNGTLLTRYAGQIVASGIDSVNISVDGDREIHNFVRRKDWAYDRAMEGIRSLGAARADAARQGPLIKICFTKIIVNFPVVGLCFNQFSK